MTARTAGCPARPARLGLRATSLSLAASVSLALAGPALAQPGAEPATPAAAPTEPAPPATEPAPPATEPAPPATTTEAALATGYPDPLPEVPNPLSLHTRMERRHGMIELGLGWLTLPDAAVCSIRTVETGCVRGDSSPALEAWQLFRLPPAYALGAGVMLGLTPTTDIPARQIEGIQREHARRYLTIEGTGRAYPYVGEKFEAWAGLTAGLVVVSDAFSTELDTGMDKPLIGSGGVVIRTEGFTATLAGGCAYEFARGWSFGGALRVGAWFLPSEPKLSPLGDEPSLAGRATYFVAGLALAYRVPL